MVSEVNGHWGTAIEVPRTAALNTADGARVDSVSFASPGNCSAGGYDNAGVPESQAFVVSEINGSWRAAVQLRGASQMASVTSVSCGSAGNCAVGEGNLSGTSQGLLLSGPS